MTAACAEEVLKIRNIRETKGFVQKVLKNVSNLNSIKIFITLHAVTKIIMYVSIKSKGTHFSPFQISQKRNLEI